MDKVKVIGNYSKSNHEASRIIDSNYSAPTFKENHGTIMAVIDEEDTLRRQLCNELIKNRKVEENDVVKINYTTDVINGKKDYKMGNNISPTLTTASNNEIGITSELRIRKLTPRECFRLMGVNDQDIDNVLKSQSDSNAYHLAGDSIVVNVLMAIFKEMM